jgi:hypothetical protein
VFLERLYALRGGRKSEVGVAFLGHAQNLTLPAPEGPVRLKQENGGIELIPPQRRIGPEVELHIGEYPMPAGLYAVYAAGKRIGYLGVNISPAESASPPLDLKAWEVAGLKTRIIAPESTAQSENRSWTLRWRKWYGWVLLSVGLLLLESWWAKRLLKVPLQVSTPLSRAS